MDILTEPTAKVNARPQVDLWFIASDEIESSIPVFVNGELRAVFVLQPEPENDETEISFDGSISDYDDSREVGGEQYGLRA